MKELPYLKFNASEWITGQITLEDFYTQGVFINICALYWFKSGCLETSEIKRRLKCKQSTIDLLFENHHIKPHGDHIKISFLDEQFIERGHVSKINSENAKKGGAPKGNSNARKPENNNRTVDLEQPKTTNIEEEKEKNKNREEKNGAISIATTDERKKVFMDKVSIHLPDYGKEMLREFFDYWTEMNEGGKKMRFEMQKVFDISRRLKTWDKNNKFRSNGKNGFDKLTSDKAESDAILRAKYGN